MAEKKHRVRGKVRVMVRGLGVQVRVRVRVTDRPRAGVVLHHRLSWKKERKEYK